MPSPHPFVLETLIDFPDDALDASHVLSEVHVEAMMSVLAKLGVTRSSPRELGFVRGWSRRILSAHGDC